MTGQDAVRSAEAFAAKLPLTGVILTKTDGDARGGAALSLATVVGKPLKFVGHGREGEATSSPSIPTARPRASSASATS